MGVSNRVLIWAAGAVAAVAAVVGVVVVATDDTPEPLGDAHVIEIARQHSSFDQISDERIIESAETKCPVLDRYGKEGFDSIAQNTVAISDLERVPANFDLLGAAVRAYCPEHIGDLTEWADDALDSLETKIVDCGWTMTGLCWRDAQ